MNADIQEAPILVGQSGDFDGIKFAMENDIFILGRDPDCDIVILDRQISRQHARLERRGAGTYLRDLGSKNGTYLNGKSVSDEMLVQDGDVIQVALAASFVFIGSDATMPLSMQDASQLGLGRMRMETRSHRIWLQNVEIDPPLSPPQYRLMELLYDHPERIITRDEIADVVWPGTDGVGVSDQAIDALVRRLRDRLAEVDEDHNYIVTVRGHGFRLDNPV